MSISLVEGQHGSLNIVIVRDGKAKSYNVPPDHVQFDAVIEAVKAKDEDAIEKLLNVVQTIVDYAEGNITVSAGVVYYQGNPVHHTITGRILDMMKRGFDIGPLCRFLDNLFQNPSRRALNELYPFLLRKAHYEPLAITEDGCFLAYKAVTSLWLDKHSGKVTYRIGSVVSVPRNAVDDNFGVACSEGLHVGSLAYVTGFSNHNFVAPQSADDDDFSNQQRDHVVVVKVNPRDVVSVPSDEDCTKCRVCSLEVLAEYVGELKALVYTSAGEEYQPTRCVSSNGRSDHDPFDNGHSGFSENWEEDDEDDEEDDEEDDSESESDFDEEDYV